MAHSISSKAAIDDLGGNFTEEAARVLDELLGWSCIVCLALASIELMPLDELTLLCNPLFVAFNEIYLPIGSLAGFGDFLKAGNLA
jgi:hypothetical protein